MDWYWWFFLFVFHGVEQLWSYKNKAVSMLREFKQRCTQSPAGGACVIGKDRSRLKCRKFIGAVVKIVQRNRQTHHELRIYSWKVLFSSTFHLFHVSKQTTKHWWKLQTCYMSRWSTKADWTICAWCLVLCLHDGWTVAAEAAKEQVVFHKVMVW